MNYVRYAVATLSEQSSQQNLSLLSGLQYDCVQLH